MKNWLFPLWVIMDILVAIAALSLWIAVPEFKTLNVSLSVFAVSLGLLLLFLRLDDIKSFARTAYSRHLLYHGTNVLLVALILGLVNYLGNKNYREFDLTAQNRNSLAQQSRKVLEMIEGPLKVTVFSRRQEWTPILSLLKLYEAQSKHLQLEAVDTDLRPDLVKRKNITENGVVVLNYQGRETQFPVKDELSVTNGILKILRSEAHKIYLVTGHGELSCQDRELGGLSHICDKIASQNYEVKSIDLAQVKDVPKDATALLILGPGKSFLDQEAAAVKRFLAVGGNVFLALAPSFDGVWHKNLLELGEEYGLSLGKDIVIDRLSTIQESEATIPIVSNYDGHHPVTRGFDQRTIFPFSASVNTVAGKDSAQLLAFTTGFPGSWAETHLAGVLEGKAIFQDGADQKGPIGLLGVGESAAAGGARESRFALLGSRAFLTNAYQPQSGNTTLFLNTLAWLLEDEGIISFNRPGTEQHPVILSEQHLSMIFLLSILLVPIVFFGAAIFVYRRRRVL